MSWIYHNVMINTYHTNIIRDWTCENWYIAKSSHKSTVSLEDVVRDNWILWKLRAWQSLRMFCHLLFILIPANDIKKELECLLLSSTSSIGGSHCSWRHQQFYTWQSYRIRRRLIYVCHVVMTTYICDYICSSVCFLKANSHYCEVETWSYCYFQLHVRV